MFCKRCGDRTDAVFDIERDIVDLSAGERLALRQERVAGPVEALEGWMRVERGKLSRHAEVAKAIDYMLKRWPRVHALPRGRANLLDEQCRRASATRLALGRKSWLFAGWERGAERAAVMYTLI
jgi:transposase